MPAKKRKANSSIKNLKQFEAPGPRLRGCNKCGCHLPYYLEKQQQKLSAANEKVMSLSNTNQLQSTTIDKLNVKLQETKTKHTHLIKESKTLQYDLATTKQLLASCKNQLERHNTTSPNLIKNVQDLTSMSSHYKRELTKFKQNLELSEAACHFKSHQIQVQESKLKDLEEQMSQLSLSQEIASQAQAAKLRNYQAEQATKVSKLKCQIKAARLLYANYRKPVKGSILSVSQIHRLSVAVQNYMEDREFSKDQQKAVVSKLVENSGVACSTNISKFQKARLSQKMGSQEQIRLYLANCTPKQCETFLPVDTVEALERRGAQNLVDKLYTHWSMALCAHLKFSIKLSRRQWQMIIRTFFQRYDQKLGWCRLWINGVRISQPYSHHKLKLWIKEVAAIYDLQEICDGQTAIVDLEVSISMMLSKECNS